MITAADMCLMNQLPSGQMVVVIMPYVNSVRKKLCRIPKEIGSVEVM